MPCFLFATKEITRELFGQNRMLLSITNRFTEKNMKIRLLHQIGYFSLNAIMSRFRIFLYDE